jgi:hypothetical protein
MQLHKDQRAGKAPPPVPLSGPDFENAAIARVVVGQSRGGELAINTHGERIPSMNQSW